MERCNHILNRKWLSDAITASGLTTTEIARRAGLSGPAVITRHIHGTTSMTVDNLYRVINVLKGTQDERIPVSRKPSGLR